MIYFPLVQKRHCQRIPLPDLPLPTEEDDCYVLPAPGPIYELDSSLTKLATIIPPPFLKPSRPPLEFLASLEVVEDVSESGISVSVDTAASCRPLYHWHFKLPVRGGEPGPQGPEGPQGPAGPQGPPGACPDIAMQAAWEWEPDEPPSISVSRDPNSPVCTPLFRWQFKLPSLLPTYQILFEIEQVNNSDPNNVFVLAKILGFSPIDVTSVPEMTPTKKVYVYDPLKGIFVDSPQMLVNRRGIAAYMNVSPPGGTPNLRWVAIGLVCPANPNNNN